MKNVTINRPKWKIQFLLIIWLYLLNNNDACDDADDCHSNNDDENISYNDNNETMTSREKNTNPCSRNKIDFSEDFE